MEKCIQINVFSFRENDTAMKGSVNDCAVIALLIHC